MAEVIVDGVNNAREAMRSIPVTFRNLCTGQTLGLMQLTLSTFALLGCWKAFPYGLDISHGKPQLVLVYMSTIR